MDSLEYIDGIRLKQSVEWWNYLGFKRPNKCCIYRLGWPEEADTLDDITQQQQIFHGEPSTNYISFVIPDRLR
jgi:hypothetical protein